MVVGTIALVAPMPKEPSGVPGGLWVVSGWQGPVAFAWWERAAWPGLGTPVPGRTARANTCGTKKNHYVNLSPNALKPILHYHLMALSSYRFRATSTGSTFGPLDKRGAHDESVHVTSQSEIRQCPIKEKEMEGQEGEGNVVEEMWMVWILRLGGQRWRRRVERWWCGGDVFLFIMVPDSLETLPLPVRVAAWEWRIEYHTVLSSDIW